jgi:hypothetical protein
MVLVDNEAQCSSCDGIAFCLGFDSSFAIKGTSAAFAELEKSRVLLISL